MLIGKATEIFISLKYWKIYEFAWHFKDYRMKKFLDLCLSKEEKEKEQHRLICASKFLNHYILKSLKNKHFHVLV